jgi:hypothetical protein
VTGLFFVPESGGDIFIRNVGISQAVAVEADDSTAATAHHPTPVPFSQPKMARQQSEAATPKYRAVSEYGMEVAGTWIEKYTKQSFRICSRYLLTDHSVDNTLACIGNVKLYLCLSTTP